MAIRQVAMGLLLAAGGAAGCSSGDSDEPLAGDVVENVVYVDPVSDRAEGRSLDVYRPGGSGLPAVVVLHGSGATKDDPLLRTIGQQLADSGLVVFVVDHAVRGNETTIPLDDGRLLREGFENAQCALRYVAEHGAEHGANPASITILGQSAGGFLGIVPTLAGPELAASLAAFNETRGTEPQTRCQAEADLPDVGGFVGFNGAYFVFQFIGLPQTDPGLWTLANPRAHATAGSLRIRFILGGLDAQTPQAHDDEVIAFADELTVLGHDARVVEVAEAEHGWFADGPVWDATLDAVLAAAGAG